MIQLILLILFSALFFQPLSIIVGNILRFCWHPPKYKKYEHNVNKSINEIAEERESTLSIDFLKNMGDSAKFLRHVLLGNKKGRSLEMNERFMKCW